MRDSNRKRKREKRGGEGSLCVDLASFSVLPLPLPKKWPFDTGPRVEGIFLMAEEGGEDFVRQSEVCGEGM